ncbi:MAG TPA: hypothetical protein VGU73_02370 [Acidimicrobiia bacterium]|nr:hypothetical protein [Acidimicrobiia bacterium]
MQTPSVLVDTRRGTGATRRPPSFVEFALATPSGSPTRRLLTNVLLAAGALLVAGSALIHLYLWADGYRHIPTIGPLFMAQGVVGLSLAVALVALPRRGVAALGAAFLLASVAALLISATAGLFGFMDTLDAPWATSSLVVEGVGAVVLLAGAALPHPST